ncbi:MAG: hypothetical protein AB7H97_06365 [Pseudobdellovibrionaceae bacterium]
MIENDSMNNIGIALKNSLLFDQWKVDFMQEPGFERALRCFVDYRIDIDRRKVTGESEFHLFLRDQIREAIINTQVFQEMKRSFEEEIESYKKELEANYKEIERLKQYETHYNLAFDLASGTRTQNLSKESER